MSKGRGQQASVARGWHLRYSDVRELFSAMASARAVAPS